MDKAIKEKPKHKSSDIRHRLEYDIEFRQTSERMIAEILDSNIENADGTAKEHTLRYSKELLEPHINSLRVSIIDGYEAGNLRNFLVYHNALRRMFEINIETVENDSINDRMNHFGQRKQRVLEMAQ